MIHFQHRLKLCDTPEPYRVKLKNNNNNDGDDDRMTSSFGRPPFEIIFAPHICFPFQRKYTFTTLFWLFLSENWKKFGTFRTDTLTNFPRINAHLVVRSFEETLQTAAGRVTQISTGTYSSNEVKPSGIPRTARIAGTVRGIHPSLLIGQFPRW